MGYVSVGNVSGGDGLVGGSHERVEGSGYHFGPDEAAVAFGQNGVDGERFHAWRQLLVGFIPATEKITGLKME